MGFIGFGLGAAGGLLMGWGLSRCRSHRWFALALVALSGAVLLILGWLNGVLGGEAARACAWGLFAGLTGGMVVLRPFSPVVSKLS